jgi:hypothetical protein
MRNAVFWDVTPCGPCKILRLADRHGRVNWGGHESSRSFVHEWCISTLRCRHALTGNTVPVDSAYMGILIESQSSPCSEADGGTVSLWPYWYRPFVFADMC